jgi:hypothetical protein
MSRINRFGFGIAAAITSGVLPAIAQPIFENWNTATCAFTDTAILDIQQPARIERVEIWYNWRSGEPPLSYTASLNGQVAFSGTLLRAECNPYQSTWCIARDDSQRGTRPGQLHHPHATCGDLPERREQW